MKSMLASLLISIVVFCCCISHAQNTLPDSLEKKTFTIVDEMPAFPGGDEALFRYLSNTIQYPKYEKSNNISGTVYAAFVIEPDGTVSNVRILKEVTGAPGFTKEAIRVISQMPKWSPGKQKGEAVAVQYNLPLKWTTTGGPPEWLTTMREGSALLGNKKYKDAIKKFNEALKLSPNQPQILFERATAKLNSGDKVGACKDWRTILEYTKVESQMKEANTFLSEFCND